MILAAVMLALPFLRDALSPQRGDGPEISAMGRTGAGCLPVVDDPIRAQDLAAAIPEFAGRTELLGPAPAPGSRRAFGVPELRRIAARLGVAAASPETCLEWPLEPLTAERVLADLVKAAPPGAHITVLDFDRHPVPGGALSFSRPALAGALWRGTVRYRERRTVPVWAKATVSLPSMVVVAARILPARQPIPAAALVLESRDVGAFGARAAATAATVAGKLPRRTIRAGEVVLENLVADSPDVARGQRVSVEVESGAARLSLEAQAQTAGRVGDRIQLKNPQSGRRFRAVVSGKGKVHIDVDAPSGRDGPAARRPVVERGEKIAAP